MATSKGKADQVNLCLTLDHLQGLPFSFALIALEKTREISHHIHGHPGALLSIPTYLSQDKLSCLYQLQHEDDAKITDPNQQTNCV